MRSFAVVVALLAAGEARADDTGTLRFGERSDLFGRLGLRYQGELGAPEGDDSIHRARLDARVGLRLRAVHWAYAVVRLRAAASGADPRDGWLELGDALDTASIALDRAHLRIESDRLPELSLSFGLVDHPIANSAPLWWDHDLAPAGFSGRYDRRLESIPLALRPAAFAYLVRSDAEGSPAQMFGGQLAATASFGLVDLEVAGAVIGFHDAAPLAAANSTDEFLLVEGAAGVGLHVIYWLPLQLSGALLANARRDAEERLAWSAAITAGRRDWAGDFDLTYRYRDVDLDAVPASLPADNYRLATGVRGHDVIANVQISEALRAGASVFLFREKINDAPLETTLRADLAARF